MSRVYFTHVKFTRNFTNLVKNSVSKNRFKFKTFYKGPNETLTIELLFLIE
jgi:hypothetical protein